MAVPRFWQRAVLFQVICAAVPRPCVAFSKVPLPATSISAAALPPAGSSDDNSEDDDYYDSGQMEADVAAALPTGLKVEDVRVDVMGVGSVHVDDGTGFSIFTTTSPTSTTGDEQADDFGAPPTPPMPPRRPRRHKLNGAGPGAMATSGAGPPMPGSKGGGGPGGDGSSGEAVLKATIADSKVKITASHQVFNRSPDFLQVAHLLILSFAVVAILYVTAHALERLVPDAAEREQLDHWIDCVGACVGLVVTYVWYGIVQEYIMTKQYETGMFPSAAFLVLSSRLCAVLLAGFVLLVTRDPLDLSACKWSSLPASMMCMCSWTQETSLRYISFPTLAALKCARIIPTMGVNTLINGGDHAPLDYLCALLVTVGVIGFSVATHVDNGEPRPGAVIGFALMVAFLFSNALATAGQRKIFTTYPILSSTQMMLVNSLFSLAVNATIVYFTFGFTAIGNFLLQNQECVGHIVCLSIASSAGQFLICYVVRTHGAVPLAVMMSVRQMLSIALSSLLSGHRLPLLAVPFFAIAVASVAARPVQTYYIAKRLRAKGGSCILGQSGFPPPFGDDDHTTSPMEGRY